MYCAATSTMFSAHFIISEHPSVCWLPQFPILEDRDIFVDGNGPHVTGGEVNIPIRPGSKSFSGPFNTIQQWLRQHIPNLYLPVDLDNMTAEDRNSLFGKIIVEIEGGQRITLMDVLKPLIRSPHWKSFNPDDYKLPYDLLKLPIKNMFIEVSSYAW